MKGEYKGSCNITACQKPNSATWYNHFNHQYYCPDCAFRLNTDVFNKRSADENLGHAMCTEVIDHTIIEENEKQRDMNIIDMGNEMYGLNDSAFIIENYRGRNREPTKRTPTEEDYKEYELILQKKSNLSRKQREEIINLIKL